MKKIKLWGTMAVVIFIFGYFFYWIVLVGVIPNEIGNLIFKEKREEIYCKNGNSLFMVSPNLPENKDKINTICNCLDSISKEDLEISKKNYIVNDKVDLDIKNKQEMVMRKQAECSDLLR